MKLIPLSPVKAFLKNLAVLSLSLVLIGGVTLAPAQAKPQFAAIAVDARTGKIISAIDMDGLRHPASLTKMMTLYMVFKELQAGRIKLSTKLTISKRAASMAPSKLGLKPGSTITVQDAIKALVTKSANDVAAAIGENLGGNETAFAARMTATARSIGMSRTTFRNASGLPNPDQWTTARDMATLGLRLQRDFPQYYPYFRIKTFIYRGQAIKNHNKLLGRYQGTDGIKTGYVAASGFNLVSSVKRGRKRVVAVVLGGTSGAARDLYMMRMLDKVLPNSTDGNTIAALPGSDKGIIASKEDGGDDTPQPLVAEADDASADTGADTAVVANNDTAPANDAALTQAQEQAAPATKGKAKNKLAGGSTTTTGKKGKGGKVLVPEQAPEDSPVETPAENKALESKIASAATLDPSPSTPLKETPDADASTTLAAASVAGSSSLPANLPFEVKKPEADNTLTQSTAAATPATVSGKSWNIQVGSYPQKEAARQRLQSMRASGYAFLKDKSAFTVAVQKGDAIVYRARFSGFNEKSAKDACARLTKRGLECVTVPPQS